LANEAHWKRTFPCDVPRRIATHTTADSASASHAHHTTGSTRPFRSPLWLRRRDTRRNGWRRPPLCCGPADAPVVCCAAFRAREDRDWPGKHARRISWLLSVSSPARSRLVSTVSYEHCRSAPRYRIESEDVEIGAGWIRYSELSEKTYVSLTFAAPEFGPRRIYANLGRAAGQDDDNCYAILWNPVD
jgi:uncharacterized protein (DUF736 family)